MINLNLIVAIGKNNELGIDNHLIWNIKEDMQYFRETTTNHSVIMGRKTYESIGRLLPKRVNIIVTKDESFKVDGAVILHNTNEVIDYVKNNEAEYFVIGGASIYKEFLPYSKTLYITEIDAEENADVFFPSFDKSLYTKEIIKEANTDKINYAFVTYTKN